MEQVASAMIYVAKGKWAIVDEDDYQKYGKLLWCTSVNKTMKPYAATSTITADGRKSMLLMHRLIMSAGKGIFVDHINLNTLDNRKINLRLCSYAGNNQNRAKFSGKSSKFKGVSLQAKSGRWRACICVNGKNIYLGEYSNEETAAKIYDDNCLKYHGEFGILNFPKKKAEGDRRL